MGIRIWLMVVVVALAWAAEVRADEVWIQYEGSTIQRHATYLHGSDYGRVDPWEAEADLINGLFRTYAAGSGGFDQNAYAGATNATLTNISGQTIQFQAGWLKAHVEGTIELTPAPGAGQVSSTQIVGALSFTRNGVYTAASARQIAAISEGFGDSSGPATPVYSHEFVPLLETNGATVDTQYAFLGFPNGLGGVSFDLVMPAFSLAPGDSFRWDFSLQTLMNTGPRGGYAAVDFLNTAKLSLTLPEGFGGALSADGVNPAAYNWITVETPPTPEPVPEPGTAALFGVGLVVVLVRRRRRLPK